MRHDGSIGTWIAVLVIVVGLAGLAVLDSGLLEMCVLPAVSVTETKVDRIKIAIEQFRSDEGYYPGPEVADPSENAFPAVFEALLGEPRPAGKGGRSAPYLDDIKLRDIVVFDNASGEFRPATQVERFDPAVAKCLLDEWGQPLWYRENKSRPARADMHNPHKFDLWSCGPDEKNQTLLAEESSDDIGNW